MSPTRHMHVKNIDIYEYWASRPHTRHMDVNPVRMHVKRMHAERSVASDPDQVLPWRPCLRLAPETAPLVLLPSQRHPPRYAGRCGWRGAVAESGRRWRWRYLPAHNVCRACASGRRLPPVALGGIDSGRTVGSLQAALPPA